MSARVSMSALASHCSGLMYAGVPIGRPTSVTSVRSVSGRPIALAMPKSMTFGVGRASCVATRTFDGFRSR
jgi:hypothetical protein